MSYKQIKTVGFNSTEHPQIALQRAQARKTHYESELLRIQCAKIIQDAKEEGKPIMVQGMQDD